ncbi:MAG: homoserine dehydrogenase [Bacteroidales bacterium]
MKHIETIGLFGFGVVGEGLFQLLKNNKIMNTEIKKICIKQRSKQRSVSQHLLTYNANDILDDEKISLVVELIDDDQSAYDIVKHALLNGKSVVSGNKKMLAKHLEEFIQLQQIHSSALLYDASACGSVPVVRNLEEYYDNDLLKSITGILNGSSNYILSQIFSKGENYHSALKAAQALGYAESDPSSDVEGLDALYKLVIITCHGFGAYVPPDSVFCYGISQIKNFDIQFAKEKNLKIKLIARVEKVNNDHFTMFVMPKLVQPDEYIYNVEDENNGVIIEGECYDKQLMFGKGAGAFPTASSVLSDITARNYNYKYEYKKRNYFKKMSYSINTELEIYLRYDNLSDYNHFEFESIFEKYFGKGFNYVIGSIKLNNLLKIQKVIKKLDVFLAFTGN